ncbi:hypothetical protein QFW96_26200 [Saccharopolyspora sp. TS4A08]|uniref:Uncharacterized protein n=1 Tax=Saccharopolyspora ipomoeae TaxID=3042027 RepID=A0ABT6PW04_9PSEU|nr:hypothetical protein [Saccharopolyspora sp. TS4A08]MDI2032136.1 hypothetical protein [Saccharopolyspora sp. TS4A08]
MDPRLRADEALARARARGAFVVTPDNATSPMDAANTVRIPRDIVNSAVDSDTDTTMLPAAGQQMPAPNQQQPQFPTADPHTGWPTEDYGQPQQALPPNPYQAQRNPNEFGPLGSQPLQQYPQQY